MNKKISQARVGFFGGTFDPIHFGHLHMAEELLERKNLDEVWFCPARINPHKLDHTPATIEHRLKMVQLAIEGKERFRLLDIEAKREGPSYTVDTLRELVAAEQERPSPRQIFLIISDELVKDFFHWQEPKEIVKMIPLIVGSRTSSKASPLLEGDSTICQAISEGWTPTTVKDVSSTEVRRRIREGLNCEDFVPKKVLDYIYQYKLYC